MNQRSILVVDDEPELRRLMKEALERAGYTNVQTAESGEAALGMMTAKMPGLILLDVMMPGMSGFALLDEIRAFSAVPVILLTAKGEAEDRVSGFECGADDYIVKPFVLQELLLRIKAVLRRAYPEDTGRVALAACSVDFDAAQVEKNGSQTALTAKEYTILKKLYDNAGKIVTTAALCQTVVGEVWTGYESTLMTHIRHLREKIERDPGNPESLITVRGLGYKLVVK